MMTESRRILMKTIDINDWVVVNNIIYKLYAADDTAKMCGQFFQNMKMVLDFDCADFYFADEKGRLGSPVFYNCDTDYSDLYNQYSFGSDTAFGEKNLVYRESDIIDNEIRKEIEIYKKIYKPNNLDYSIHISLNMNKKFIGIFTFYRSIGKNDFDYDDIFLLDMLKEHLALKLYRRIVFDAAEHEKLTVTEASEKYGLTRQETMVLKMLMQGLDNTTIYTSLNISVNTLKKHILNIYRKLKIKNRVQMFKMIKEKE